jgi:predicted molibdopterin-dependent oxidoreductase YjgC
VFLDLARRVRPDRADALSLGDTAEVRREIARVVPMYDGIQRLSQQGDQFQYGGPHLCIGWHFSLPGGRARFVLPGMPAEGRRVGEFTVTSRRGKQFNTMIHESRDAITGAGRDAVFISAEDAARLGVRSGDRVRLVSAVGRFEGRATLAEIRSGELQVHWPEGNALIDRARRSPKAGIPDYNATVRVEKV